MLYIAVSVSLPVPLIGLTVIHSASSLTVQFVFDVTVNAVLPDAFVTDWFDGLTVSVNGAADCVTVTVLVIPPPVTVIVPILSLVVVFS